MVADLSKLKSHPDKFLISQKNGEKGHVDGVIENVKKLTNSKWAELIAIFHDLGKINPNFQDKLEPNKTIKGYSNHSYLSAFSFFCAFAGVKENCEKLNKWIGADLSQNDLIILTVLIAKHHGNLPNFSPEDYAGAGANILSKLDNQNLFKFLNKKVELPINEFAKHYFQTNDFQKLLLDERVQKGYMEGFVYDGDKNSKPLDSFLNAQFAFASLLQADKSDAAKFYNLIDDNYDNVHSFCSVYQKQLGEYISKLNQDSTLNQLRTKIRVESIVNIVEGLNKGKRVFDLTSPTGSGKTLMLLSLALEIIKQNGDYRIIYALPFLSITEQVESEVLKIFSEIQNFIQRIDSKSENKRFEALQESLDGNPDEEKIREINLLDFQENAFAFPFVITTFVRFFETLLSNRNSELLKLPNFSKSIFLIDEIQSLPPRLYGFFVAYLTKFCEKFDCYAIVSTATQPNFQLPDKKLSIDSKGKGNGRFMKYTKDFFPNYEKPYPLLSLNYFKDEIFNRYIINFDKEPIDLRQLKDKIISENKSVLIILNTIDDTKELFKLLEDDFQKNELSLLNTHFTPNHRKKKIEIAKRRLETNQLTILISTQLIEAGVDIDFPVLYRDFATVSSIIQSAGRCNRNGKLPELGKVVLFKLMKNGKNRSDLIYRGKDGEILRFTKESFTEKTYQEKNLINVQKEFFNRIKDELNFATHSQSNISEEFHFLQDIQEFQFGKIGKFQLIDAKFYGETIQYFVPDDNEDNKFENLLNLQSEISEMFRVKKIDKDKIRLKKKLIEMHLKKMAGQIVSVRLKNNSYKPLLGNGKDYFGIFKISLSSYSFEKGVDLKGEDSIL